MSDTVLPIALTLGDAAGIGPEIIAQSFLREPEMLRGCFVAGDVQAMRRALAVVQGAVSLPVVQIATPAEVLDLPPRCLPVLQVGDALPQVAWGQVSAAAGEFAGRCVLWAADAALRGEVAALVTAPLHKEALSAAGAPYDAYPGHTEMLQAAAARNAGVAVDAMPVRMMLANDELRTVLVSIHMALRQAIDARLGSAHKTVTQKELRNVGPSVSYKLRDAAGQAREYQNYMLPIKMDSDPNSAALFLLGTRDKIPDVIAYLSALQASPSAPPWAVPSDGERPKYPRPT